MTGALRTLHLSGPFAMRRGGVLPEVHIAYETWGELSPDGDNVVLLLTGLSPGPHAASSPEDPSTGWWEYMVGPGKPIDTNRWFVVCPNTLGSCFGSTGPASVNPRTGRRYQLDFPELTLEDTAEAARAALRVLGIGHVHTLVGTSLGGMAALAYAAEHPDEVDELVVVSGATAATPYAIATRSLQREMIRSDPHWAEGYYDPEEGPVAGMRLARKLGLMSYRSPEEWLERFGRQRVPAADDRTHQDLFDPEFQVESYLEANARKFVGHYDPNSYLYLSRAMDIFELADHGGGDRAAAFERMRLERALIMGVSSDCLFPLWQQRELAEGLQAAGQPAELAALDSIQGHDAFLVDEARFAPVMADFFAGWAVSPPDMD
jgi:homoserine O-acetyltransferase